MCHCTIERPLKQSYYARNITSRMRNNYNEAFEKVYEESHVIQEINHCKMAQCDVERGRQGN